MKKIELTKRQKNFFLKNNKNSQDVIGFYTVIGILFKDDKNYFLKKGKNFVFIGKNISKIEVAEDNLKRSIFKIYDQNGLYILYNKVTENFSSWEFPISRVERIKETENLLFIITKDGKYLLEKDRMSILEKKLPIDMITIEYDEKLKLLTLYSKKEKQFLTYNVSMKKGIRYYDIKKIDNEVYIVRENQIKYNENDIGSTLIDLTIMEPVTVVDYGLFIQSINKFSENFYYLEMKNMKNKDIKFNYRLIDIKNYTVIRYYGLTDIRYGYIDDYDKREFLGKDDTYTYILLSNSKNGNKEFLKIKENLYFDEKFIGNEISKIGKLKRNIFGKVTIKCFSKSGSYAIFNFNKMKLSNWKF